MCVICVSPSGIPQPSLSTIYTMFDNNPDGAGYMFARDGKVHIHKGFMDASEFIGQIKSEHFTADDSVVYHFRISTQAGVNPQMTHPFPLSNKLRHMEALDVICKCGVAHNGIIKLTADPFNTRYSDTALFIAEYLSKMLHKSSDLKNEELMREVGNLAGSKLAIMDGSGYVATVGDFINERGNLYSNWSFVNTYWQRPRSKFAFA